MRLTRKAFNQNTNHEPRELANKAFPDAPPSLFLPGLRERVDLSFDGKEFSLCILGVDGIRNIQNSRNEYKYEIILTLKEVRSLLSRSLKDYYPDFPGSREISDAERKLWNTLFDQWEKRIRALARREKKIREQVQKQIQQQLNKTVN